MQVKQDILPSKKEIYADKKLQDYYGVPYIGERVIEYGCVKCGSPDVEKVEEWHKTSSGDHACDAEYDVSLKGYKCKHCGAFPTQIKILHVVSERFFPKRFNEKKSKQVLEEAKKNMPLLGDKLITMHHGILFTGKVTEFDPEEDFGDGRRTPIITTEDHIVKNGGISGYNKIHVANFIKDNDGKLWQSLKNRIENQVVPLDKSISKLESKITTLRESKTKAWNSIIPLTLKEKEEDENA